MELSTFTFMFADRTVLPNYSFLHQYYATLMRKKIIRSFFYLMLVMALFFAWRCYQTAEIEAISWLLMPVVFLVECISGISFEWSAGLGYLNESARIMINKSCAGGQFFLLSTGILWFCFLPSLKSIKEQLVLVLLTPFITFLTTIFANTARISTALLGKKLGLVHELLPSQSVHLAIGVMVYLVCLLLLYLAFQRFLFVFATNHIPVNLPNQS